MADPEKRELLHAQRPLHASEVNELISNNVYLCCKMGAASLLLSKSLRTLLVASPSQKLIRKVILGNII